MTVIIQYDRGHAVAQTMLAIVRQHLARHLASHDGSVESVLAEMADVLNDEFADVARQVADETHHTDD